MSVVYFFFIDISVVTCCCFGKLISTILILFWLHFESVVWLLLPKIDWKYCLVQVQGSTSKFEVSPHSDHFLKFFKSNDIRFENFFWRAMEMSLTKYQEHLKCAFNQKSQEKTETSESARNRVKTIILPDRKECVAFNTFSKVFIVTFLERELQSFLWVF